MQFHHFVKNLHHSVYHGLVLQVVDEQIVQHLVAVGIEWNELFLIGYVAVVLFVLFCP